MIDLNKHKYFMLQILRDIYADVEISNCLGFKGGTAAMFFYKLPRFSVDLDFNLLKSDMRDFVYQKLRAILLKYGKIDDGAQKFFGDVLVLNYGSGERNLKIEVSNRLSDSRYEVRSAMGINMLVMALPDMFAHKLCALLDRNELTNRDIFDCWFFMENRTPLNAAIVESRMKMPLADYLQQCIAALETMTDGSLLNGLGELVNPELKTFIRNKLRSETIFLLNLFKELPLTTQ